MDIQTNRVVEIHYILKDKNGVVIDSSEGREPLAYLHGTGALIKGLESALTGKKSGDSFEIVVQPEDGYGTRNEDAVQQIPRSSFEGIADLEVGMRLQAQTDAGVVPITVVDISEEYVTVDGNHLLAGVTLYFSVKIESVRAATPEEIAHGHVH